MMKSKKIAFMFGAGAEGKNNFDLPLGNDFMNESLTYDKAFFKAIGSLSMNKNFNGKEFKYENRTIVSLKQNIYKKVSKIWLLSKLDSLMEELKGVSSEEIEKELKKISENNFVIDFLDKDEYKTYFNKESPLIVKNKDKDKDKEKDKVFAYEFRRIVFEEIKESGINIDDELRKSVEDFLGLFNVGEKNISENGFKLQERYTFSVGFLLDEYFHTLINPEMFGPDKFLAVYNYYWNIFMVIYSKVIDWHNIIIREKKKELRKDFDYKVIEENLQRLAHLDIVDFEKKSNKRSYYSEISRKFENSENDMELSGILTSNYFRFAEICFPSNAKNIKIAYLNGKLNWFEYPGKLRVLDVTSKDGSQKGIIEKELSNEFFFPFIMGQSYVKPLIHSLQLDEYAKADIILDKSNYLIILGYNINSDDNHINSYLVKYLDSKKDNSLIIVCSEWEYDIEGEYELKHHYSRKLYTSNTNRIHLIGVDYKLSNEKIIEAVFEKISVI